MHVKRYIIGLAIAAGLALPATASAQVPVVKAHANYDTVVISAAKGQCLTVDTRKLGYKQWWQVDNGDLCDNYITFTLPKASVRDEFVKSTTRTFYKYRVNQATGGGQPTVPPSYSDSFLDATCYDFVDNDGDGLFDSDDRDFPSDTDNDGDDACDRGVTPLVVGSTIASGWVRVTTVHYPIKFIDQYVNGHYNDAFYNYCIKKGKELHSSNHGEFWCTTEGSTRRTISLAAPRGM